MLSALVFVVPTLVSAVAIHKIEERTAAGVFTSIKAWTDLLDSKCMANTSCQAELSALNTCGQTFIALNSSAPADLATAEKCVCSAVTGSCATCEQGVVAPSANATALTIKSFTAFASAYNAGGMECLADGDTFPGGSIAIGSYSAVSTKAGSVATVAKASSAPVVVASSAPAASKASVAASGSAVSPAAASATKAASATSIKVGSGLGLGVGALALFAAL
ncbi:hypothetical protein RQP46_007245 [Phenoliferia psychrophenolica]